MQSNNGIVVNGGSFNSGNVAVGENAMVTAVQTQREKQMAEIADQLRSLLTAIGFEGQRLPSSAQVVQDTQELKSELTKPQPDPHKVSSLFKDMEEGAKSLASIAGMVQTLKPVVFGMLGLG